MRQFIIVMGIVLVMMLIHFSCQSPVETIPGTGNEPKITILTGKVFRNDTYAPVPGAFVVDASGSPRDTTKNDGSYSLTYSLSKDYNATIIASRTLFKADTGRITLKPGINDSLSLTIKADTASPPTGGGGKAAGIVLISSSQANISIRGTGANETAQLIFEVRDSIGLPMGVSNRQIVKFKLRGGPQGGEYISPDSSLTDQTTGRVVTQISSGKVAGILQVYAYLAADTNIKSTPVRITIAGGYPDAAHFSISVEKQNIAGYLYDGLTNKMNIIVGDKFGNPVPKGTAIYFTTTAGIIQSSASTDDNGQASVQLLSGNPRPSAADSGKVYVTATTLDSSGNVISATATTIFSSYPIITPVYGFTSMGDGGAGTLIFKVSDKWGNSLVEGATVSAKIVGLGENDIKLSGDVPYTFPDMQSPAFISIGVRDGQPKGDSGQINLTVNVDGKNGKTSYTYSFILRGDSGGTTGTGPIVPTGATSGYLWSLTLKSISPSQLSVKGTGETETAYLIFQAKDSLGRALTANRKAYVQFTMPSGGPNDDNGYFFPLADSTDAYGEIRTIFNSGRKAGVVQIRATGTATVPSIGVRTVLSSPVQLTVVSGLPSQTNFSVWSDKLNYPGYFSNSPSLGTISARLGDKWGNPVQPKTAVYFTTSGGIITASAATGSDGFVTASLYGGNPLPQNGRDTITVQTVGDAGLVEKKIVVTFSGAPRINNLSIPNPTDTLKIPDGQIVTVYYTLADSNGNPLASGNAVSIAVTGPASGELALSGDVTFVTADDTVKSRAYGVTITDTKPKEGAGGMFEVTITVTGPNGATLKRFLGKLSSVTGGGTVTTSGPAATIALKSIGSQKITLLGTGATESTTMTFVVKDDAGNVITPNRRVKVQFNLSGVGAGVKCNPVADSTNDGGEITTRLTAGDSSGLVQIIAQITNSTIVSEPIKVSISGGLPDSAYFTANLSKMNMPGLVSTGDLSTVSVQLGDKFGNPVIPNTLVQFYTNGGLISASGYTNDNGQTSAILRGGNPPPPHPIRGVGWGTLTIRTTGMNSVTLTKQLPFLFTGSPKITLTNMGPADTVKVMDGSSANVSFIVSDANGNPLSEGTSVNVSVDGAAKSEIVLGGQTTLVLADDTVRGRTYTFKASDTQAGEGNGGFVQYRIAVTGPNGNYTFELPGWVGKPGDIGIVLPTGRTPAQIKFINVSVSDLAVSGVAGIENAVVTYEVQDAMGQPLNQVKRAYATFTTQFFPNSRWNGGTPPTLIPAADSTDDQGRVRVSVNSGTQAGVLSVFVRIALPTGVVIKSEPVKMNIFGGFADSAHFSLYPSYFVYAHGVSSTFPGFTVLVGDTFSNPVSVGTSVYFQTQAGIIQTRQSYTDIDGMVTVNYLGGAPYPENPPFRNSRGPGYFWVTAQTEGRNGKWIQDSIEIYESVAPVSMTPPVSINLPNGGVSVPLNLTVTDGRGNPLPPGTTISYEFKLPPVSGVSFELTGDLPFTMPNNGGARYLGSFTTGVGYTGFTFQAVDVSTVATAGMQAVLKLTVTSSLGNKVINIPVFVI
jgi:hypothetical protein